MSSNSEVEARIKEDNVQNRNICIYGYTTNKTEKQGRCQTQRIYKKDGL